MHKTFLILIFFHYGNSDTEDPEKSKRERERENHEKVLLDFDYSIISTVVPVRVLTLRISMVKSKVLIFYISFFFTFSHLNKSINYLWNDFVAAVTAADAGAKNKTRFHVPYTNVFWT